MIKLRSTEELIARIKQVFPTTPLPLDTDIPSDSYAVNKYLQGKSWPEVTAKGMRLFDFDGPSSYLSFLKPKGFCYFLPAYLMMALFETKVEDRHQYFNLYYSLTPEYAWSHQFIITDKNRQEPDDYFLGRIAPLTAEQKQVVADFLFHQSLYNGTELRLDDLWNEEPRKAFDAYWYQFATQK